MKVAGVFTDYDGTIAPIGVPRRESRVPEALLSSLVRLATRIPVAVITSKDIIFVRPRTMFARGWACAMGMEIVLADGKRQITDYTAGCEASLGMLDDLIPQGVTMEKKLASDGRILGFSIDWSDGPQASLREVAALISVLRASGLHVRHEDDETFIDAFCAKTDKGAGLSSLRTMLEVKGAVMYLGDSVHDNDAFDLAEIPVGVCRGQQIEPLRCRYLVDHELVAEMLDRLLDRDLEFTPSIVKEMTGGRVR